MIINLYSFIPVLVTLINNKFEDYSIVREMKMNIMCSWQVVIQWSKNLVISWQYQYGHDDGYNAASKFRIFSRVIVYVLQNNASIFLDAVLQWDLFELGMITINCFGLYTFIPSFVTLI